MGTNSVNKITNELREVAFDIKNIGHFKLNFNNK